MMMKKSIIDILFSGIRYSSKKIKFLSEEQIKFLYDETKNCTSDNVKDRVYWLVHDIKDYRSCKNCGNLIIKHNVKYFSNDIKNQEYCTLKCRMTHPEFHEKARNTLFERTGYRSAMENPEARARIEQTNIERYGFKNVFQSDFVKNKIKRNSLEKYGIEHPAATELAKLHRKQTMLARYGVDNPLKIQKIREAAKQTMIRLYGEDNAGKIDFFNDKAKSTNLKKYGCEHPSHTEKSIITNLKKYGVRHPMQDFKIFQKVMKSRFKIKKYITESGSVIQYQGYEDVVLKFLLKDLKIPEDQIITNRASIPKIFYFNHILKKSSRYYPDIWVKSHNLLIEVKSKFTFNHQTDITLAKQKACKIQNINHIIVICSKKTILEIIL